MSRAVDSLLRRIMLIVGRGKLTGCTDGKRQFMQFTALRGEVKDYVERVQEYGFSSNPLAGAQVLFICMGGNRDHPVIISADDPRYRPADLQAGEVCLYTDEGDFIRLRRNREIEISTARLIIKASDEVRVETPEFNVTGDIRDRCDENGRTLYQFRDIYDDHHHPENDDGGPTDAPNEKMNTP